MGFGFAVRFRCPQNYAGIFIEFVFKMLVRRLPVGLPPIPIAVLALAENRTSSGTLGHTLDANHAALRDLKRALLR